MAKGSSIQALFELCRKTFSSLPASSSPQAIKKLSSLMDAITPSEVGLDDVLEDESGHGFFGSSLLKNSNRTARWAQPITYLHIYECDSFTIGIFCLPTSSVIPLHDHPGMTVLSKILYGSMHVKSYDWVEPSCVSSSGRPDNIPGRMLLLEKGSKQSFETVGYFVKCDEAKIIMTIDNSDKTLCCIAKVRLAKLHTETVLSAPCQTTVLYPKTGGNLHCFTAVTSCAVLDVLTPPYSEAHGRYCTYYQDHPYSSFSTNHMLPKHEKEEDYAWLEAIESPDNLHMRSGKYTGPAVQDHAL